MENIKFLFLLLFLSAGQRLMAVDTLVVWYVDGTTTDIELSILPKIRFVDNKLMIQASGLQMEIDEEDVSRFTYKNSEASDIQSVKRATSFNKQESNIILHGTSLKDKVTVSKMNGVNMPIRLVQRGGDLVLPLISLPSGVYLLTVNGRTTKIILP